MNTAPGGVQGQRPAGGGGGGKAPLKLLDFSHLKCSKPPKTGHKDSVLLPFPEAEIAHEFVWLLK